jgi:hypothetical protein
MITSRARAPNGDGQGRSGDGQGRSGDGQGKKESRHEL